MSERQERKKGQELMPAAFIGHGSPLNTLERNRDTTAWRVLGEKVPRPRAVLALRPTMSTSTPLWAGRRAWGSSIGGAFSARTFSARGPFGPRPASKLTCCPSRKSSKRVPVHAEEWKKYSS